MSSAESEGKRSTEHGANWGSRLTMRDKAGVRLAELGESPEILSLIHI